MTRVTTNVITGFLGVGKSTAILHLLKQRPANERWAVLVNEFGEVGIDGTILKGSDSEDQGVFIREVAGGCMCCAAGLPMRVALATLLARGRPDRLLVEPTGLGHPEEVIELLSADYYRDELDLRATITLVDARNIKDPRYTNHPTFVQQLTVADLVVANKADHYDPQDLPALQSFLRGVEGLEGKPLAQVEHGALRLDWLAPPAGYTPTESHRHDHADSQLPPAPEIPESGFLRIDNEGEGFFSRGWIFDSAWSFDEAKLDSLLLGVEANRVKGVFATDRGVSAYNMVDDVMTKTVLAESEGSRVEVISADPEAFAGLEEALMDCATRRPGL